MHKPSFDVAAMQVEEQKEKMLRKYFTPSEPNWGPAARATGGKKAKKENEDEVPKSAAEN